MKSQPQDRDRARELERYNDRATESLRSGDNNAIAPEGAESVAYEIRAPYLTFEQFIRDTVRQGDRVLDVCCGSGTFSLIAARLGAHVTVSDIAPANVELATVRGMRAGISLEARVADAECLPFPEGSFDIVICAGSLSYVDLNKFLSEISRVLVPGGCFIAVDSLNHNPAYVVNRYIHFLRGRRTRSTLKRMPKLRTIAEIRERFPDLQCQFFGTIAFMSPLLRILGRKRARKVIDRFDQLAPGLNRFAFKFVLRGRRVRL